MLEQIKGSVVVPVALIHKWVEDFGSHVLFLVVYKYIKTGKIIFNLSGMGPAYYEQAATPPFLQVCWFTQSVGEQMCQPSVRCSPREVAELGRSEVPCRGVCTP